jgi:hypothetical protein
MKLYQKIMKFLEKLLVIKIAPRLVPRGYVGFSFLFFIFVREQRHLDNKRLINHEKIHFYQQVEMLFIFQWIAYGLSYIINVFLITIGRKDILPKHYWRDLTVHKKAYRNNIFELEAIDMDDDLDYLNKRRPYAWVKWFKQYKKRKELKYENS